MRLTKKQTVALDYLENGTHDEILFGGGAGGGKSAVGCYWILKNCFKYNGSRWMIGRSKLKTLKETTLVTLFEICKMQGIDSSMYNYNAQSGTITFLNGSQILLKDLFSYPSDPNFDGLGSLEISGAFIDECNQIVEKAWNIVKSRIRFKLDVFNIIPKILGTCNPSKGWVYTRFYKPDKEGILTPDKVFIQSLLTDNPHISKHYRKNLESLDKNSKERLLFGNWEYDDDPSALMSYDKITDLFSNSHVEEGSKYITADIARFGSDKTVIGCWSGYRLEEIKTIKSNTIPEAVEAIRKMKNKYGVPMSSIVADEDGLGGGVVDMLKCKGFVANSRPFNNENYNNLKSQCGFKLSEIVNEGQMYISSQDTDIQEMIIEEMEQIKHADMDSDNKNKLVPKEKIKELIGRSPDFSDMILMRMYFEMRVKLSTVW